MGLYTQAVQQLYVAYFNRPADPVGLAYWEGQLAATDGAASTLGQISAAFSTSPEYTAAFQGKNEVATVDQVYMNLFGRHAEAGGLLYWAGLLANKQLTISNIVTAVAGGALTTDADAYNNKVTAATNFTAGLTTAEQIRNYSGDAALQLAKNYIAGVTDAASLQAANDGLDATIAAVVAAGDAVNNKGQTYTLTTGIDSFTGGAGNDTFVSTATTGQTLTSFDKIDGGAGNNDLQWTSATNSNVTIPSSLTVKNIQTATLVGDGAISVDTTNWTGLTSLSVTPIGAATVTSAATTDVTVTTNQGTTDATLNGGKNVTLTSTAASTGNVVVGGTVAPAGAVVINRTEVNGAAAGSIQVSGGTTVSITTTAANPVNTTHTNGTVAVTGGSATTSVSVTNSAAQTASATKNGVVGNSVAITDVNGGTTSAGTITSVSVDGYTTLGISDNALKTLSLAHGSGNIIIDNSGLAAPTNKTLGLTVNALTGGTLDDADIYTTLNVTTAGANSTLANVTFGALTALTVGGSKNLTITSTAGLSALKTVVVSGSAGITADLSGATVTSVDTSATTGTSKVTIDAAKATFNGGAGSDVVVLAATAPTKAISLGAGDDSLTLNGATAPTAKIDGGTGNDSLTMSAALAATASGSSSFAGIVTNFEKLTLTAATNQTIDLDILGKFSAVTTAGGNGLTLSNLPSGGSLSLTGAGTAYTIGNSAFSAGTNDTINLNLSDSSGAGVAFASTGITASGVENFVITTTDGQATPSGTFSDSVTLLGNSVKAITVSGNAGLTLASTSTALTSVDASGISLGGFSWTSGALAAAATIKGSATGTNTINVAAATGGAVTYTGGTGNDTVNAANGKGNTLTLGDGDNSAVVTAGNNTITGGAGNDTVTATSGNNTVSLGNGTNAFTATSGNNTYTGGTGVDTVTVGGGSNMLTLGTGADVVNITTAGANVNTYTTIADPHAGITISFADKGTEVFNATKVTLANTAVFQDYANAVIQAGGNSSTNGHSGWFQFNGDTYYVQSQHDGSGVNASFVNGTDFVVKLTGLIDLSSSTIGGTNTLTIV